jgi:hypothetical protein
MNIYDSIVEYLENGRKGVLVTVIRRTGSSPRDVAGEDDAIKGVYALPSTAVSAEALKRLRYPLRSSG